MKKSKTNKDLNLDFSSLLKDQDSSSKFSMSNRNDMLQNMYSNKDKNSIIYQLQKELDYLKEVNKNYLKYSSYSTEVTKKYEKNYNEILVYKEKLEKELNGFILRMKSYENLKHKNMDFKEEITKNKENTIQIILKDQKKLQDAFKKISDDCLNLENENKELLKKLEKITIDMQKEQKESDEIYDLDNKTISLVQERLDENQFKIDFYKNKEQIRLLGFSLNGDKQNEQKNKEDLEM